MEMWEVEYINKQPRMKTRMLRRFRAAELDEGKRDEYEHLVFKEVSERTNEYEHLVFTQGVR